METPALSISHCRVVLVQPHIAGNIGATARVMRNMGLTDLVLVDPKVDPLDAQARKRSTHGEDILHNARIVGDLGDGVGNCVCVAGTSARIGGLFRRQSVGPPDQIMPSLVSALASGPVALVFGTEARGLSNADVTRCHFLIHVPADPTYPALNLGQAVAVCLYELRRCWLSTHHPAAERARPAPFADQERMFDQLKSGLEDVHFLYGPSGASLMHAIRHLIGRGMPTPMEVDLLFGLARQLRWVARQSKRNDRDAQPPGK